MSRFSTVIGFILGAMLVISVMSTAISWMVYIGWQGLFGSAPPFWIFWSGCSMGFMLACFIATLKR